MALSVQISTASQLQLIIVARTRTRLGLKRHKEGAENLTNDSFDSLTLQGKPSRQGSTELPQRHS
jgi:hypothetical protein